MTAATDSSGLRHIDQAAGFDAGWEIDVFGGYRREIEASSYDTQAAAEARNTVLVTVVTDVARAYLDMRGFQARISAFWNFLDFDTLDALVDIADLRTREQLGVYQATIINAVSEVDTAIDAYSAQRDGLENVADALTASQQAEDYASERHRRGLTDFLNVLDTQRQEYDLEDQYVAGMSATADAFVTSYKTLGVGWEEYQSIPPILVGLSPQSSPRSGTCSRRLLMCRSKDDGTTYLIDAVAGTCCRCCAGLWRGLLKWKKRK